MNKERYKVLVREIAQFIKLQDIEDVASLLNDLKFDVLATLYENDNDIRVVKRGVKIEPFSKDKLAENLAISSDYVSDEAIGDALDTDDIINIVDGIVDRMKTDGKKAVSSDEIVSYTKAYLEDRGYDLVLDGYKHINTREDRRLED